MYRVYKPGCSVHGFRFWIESIPAGHGYCQQCAKDNYPDAKLGEM